MPLSDVDYCVDWGYLSVGYVGVDERFGKQRDFQQLVDQAHQRGIAVVVDAVYGHTGGDFCYQYVYDQLQYHENPVMGKFAQDLFGFSTDYKRPFTQDFFYSVNHYWLEKFHVDGFRYDCVPNYYDGPVGDGYANLTYHTYLDVKSHQGNADHWQRFFSNNTTNLIQCAEELQCPQEILQTTYSNCTWQNGTLDAAKGIIAGNQDALTTLGNQLVLAGYPTLITNQRDTLVRTALQYVENH